MKVILDALTFDDVLLVPNYSEVLPANVNLKTHLTRDIQLNVPLISAAMDTVTEARLAITLAEAGGIGVLHKSMSIARQAEEVVKVKKFESGIVRDPITVTPDTTVRQVMHLAESNGFSGMPVVDGQKVVGIVTNRDTRFETNLDQPVSNLMTPQDKLITIKEGTTREDAMQLFQKHRLEKVLVVDDDYGLKGLMTVRDILKSESNPFATKSESGQLRVAAAVGVGGQTMERVEALVAAGVDVIVVDTAHGFTESVIEQIKSIKSTYPELPVIGGNIATYDAAKALAAAGVDGVKVGMGPGSICITRVVAGIGVPQITAISEVARALKGTGIPLIADGGIRYSGDIGKAIAAGASTVMIGSLFAGAEEAPGEVILYQGRSYKSYRGMGSVGAMGEKDGSSDRYFQTHHKEERKLVPEGIEGRVPYKGSLMAIVHQLMGGLRATMGYTGCENIDALQTESKFVRVTNAGVRESHVHDVIITKETPNYQVEKE